MRRLFAGTACVLALWGASVIEAAPKAGFTLAKSEVNANPLDTKDYPFDVWTLPPTP